MTIGFWFLKCRALNTIFSLFSIFHFLFLKKCIFHFCMFAILHLCILPSRFPSQVAYVLTFLWLPLCARKYCLLEIQQQVGRGGGGGRHGKNYLNWLNCLVFVEKTGKDRLYHNYSIKTLTRFFKKKLQYPSKYLSLKV